MPKGLILNPISGGMSRNSRRRAKGLMSLRQRRKATGGLARGAAKGSGGRSMARKRRRSRNAVPMGRAWRKAWEARAGRKIRRGASTPKAWKSAWKSGMRRAVQTGGGVAVLNPRKRKRRVRSKRLKSWLSVVKKHRGNMKAAAREWKGGRTTKRRRKKRRRAANPLALNRRRVSSPKRRRKSTRARRNARVVRRRSVSRRGVRRRSVRRRRNPIAVRGVVRNVKALLAKAALKDYAYVTGGFIAGAVVPRFVTKGLEKIGVLKTAPGPLVNALIGVGSAVGTGAIVGAITKSRNAALKVTAGGMAGVIGSLILMELDKRGVLSGLGQTEAEAALRRAVDSEIRKQVGMGQFVSPEQVSEVATVAGRVGQFVSPEEVADVEAVAGYGMGQDVESGAQAFDGFEGGAEF